ncbi:TPA: hypothetical protein ACGIK9_002800 [Acinetobacter baumannii]|uniref:hypothetical protein n=1 Tax=Acinetobacter baumannii TaxID=470 RepID=UPI00338F7D97
MKSPTPISPYLEHSKAIVSIRNIKNGKLEKPLTKDLNEHQLREWAKTNLNLSEPETTDDGFIRYALHTEELLKTFTDHIVKMINSGFKNQFANLQQYDQDGIFRAFSENYYRILDGNLEPGDSLYADLGRLLEHHKKLFLSMKGYEPNHNFIYNSPYSFSQISNISMIEQEFAVLVNVVLMAMVVHFKRPNNLKYYKHTPISNDISLIKGKIESFIFDRQASNDNLFEEFIAATFISNPKIISQYESILGREISREYLSHIIGQRLYRGEHSHDQHYVNRFYQLRLADTATNQFQEYFETLLKLYEYISKVEDLNEHLIEMSDNEVSEFPSHYLYLIKKDE